jgi:hypothetical protein
MPIKRQIVGIGYSLMSKKHKLQRREERTSQEAVIGAAHSQMRDNPTFSTGLAHRQPIKPEDLTSMQCIGLQPPSGGSEPPSDLSLQKSIPEQVCKTTLKIH